MIHNIDISNKGDNFVVYRCIIDNSNEMRYISFVLSRQMNNLFKLYDTKFLLDKMCSYVSSISRSECNKGITHDFGVFTLKVFNSHSCRIMKTIQSDPLANLIIEQDLLKHKRNNNYQIIASNALLIKHYLSISSIGVYECTGSYVSIDEGVKRLITIFNQFILSFPWNSICYLLSDYYIFGKAYKSALYSINHGEPSNIPSKIIIPTDDLIISILKKKLKRAESRQYHLSKNIKKWVYT